MTGSEHEERNEERLEREIEERRKMVLITAAHATSAVEFLDIVEVLGLSVELDELAVELKLDERLRELKTRVAGNRSDGTVDGNTA